MNKREKIMYTALKIISKQGWWSIVNSKEILINILDEHKEEADAATKEVDAMLEEDKIKLFEYIAHGDEKHRQWLKLAINNYFDDKPKPPIENT